MDAERVFLPAEKALNGRVSMTMLRHFDACPRSAYLYQLHKGEHTNEVMQRGRAVHLALERCTRIMLAEKEGAIPGELAKAVVDDVLSSEHVPLGEHDYMRECIYRWANEWRIDPARSVVVEPLIALQLGRWTVRCRVDFAERIAPGKWYVADYKTGRGMPSQEDVARKRADGTLAAKSFQLIVYALALAYGHEILDDTTGEEESAPIAAGAHHFDLEYVFPGIETSDGLIARRPMTLTSLELAEYRESLEGVLVRLGEAEQYGEWKAIVSDAACNECPAPSACPIWRQLRDNRGSVTSMEQAIRGARVHHNVERQVSRLRSELKAFAKREKVSIDFDGMRWDFAYQEKEELTNRPEIIEAAAAGRPVIPQTRVAKLSPFERKPIPEEELSDVQTH